MLFLETALEFDLRACLPLFPGCLATSLSNILLVPAVRERMVETAYRKMVAWCPNLDLAEHKSEF